MTEKLLAGLTLLGILVVLILAARAYRTFNSQGYPDPTGGKNLPSALGEVATALPKVILAALGIFGGLVGVAAIVALLSGEESVAIFVVVALGLGMAGLLTRWIWRDMRRRTLQPWEHPSTNPGDDHASKK